ncbi:MAG TPA: MFS transporter [Burkholderiales bacterium]|nr:MFS transporter [Burkholderiales bacterium]
MKNKYFDFLILATSAISIFIVSVDMAIVSSTIPFLSKQLNITPNQASTVLLSYYLALSSSIIFLGKLSDVIGTIRIFKYGCWFFVLGALFSGFSPNLTMLIIFRFIQGIGGAILLPIHGAMISKFLPSKHSGKFFGIITFFAGAAWALGFILGGIIGGSLTWPWIFWANVPCGILALYLIKLLNKKALKNKITNVLIKNKQLDLFAGFINFLALLSITYLFNQFYNISFKHIIFLMILISILIYIFIKRINNQSHPLVNPKIFKNYYIMVPIIVAFLLNIVYDGFNFINPFYLNSIKQLKPNQMGLILAILPISSMVIGPVAGIYCDRLGAYISCLFASFLIVLAMLLLYFCNQTSSIFYIMSILIIFGIAISVFFTANIKLIMQHANSGDEGVISSLKASTSYFGGVIGFSSFAQIISFLPINNPTNLDNLIFSFKKSCLLGIIIALLIFIMCFFQKEN